MPDPLGAPPPGPLLPDDPYAAILREQAASRTQRLKTSLIQADQTPPDRAADILRLVKETGIPGAIIDRNYDTIRTRARITNTPYHDIAQHSPALGEWASEPVNAQVAHDDMENLGWLEWVMTAPQQAVQQTLASQGYGALRSRELFGETLTQAEHDQMGKYKHDMREGGALGVGPSWFSARGVIVETAKLATMIGSSYPVYGLAGAAVLGTAGAVAGTFVEPGAGTYVGAVQGARLGLQAGSTYGMAKMAFQTSAAAAYDEFLETPDELGHRMDPAAARVAALAYGAANAGIMVIGGKIAKGAIERGTEKLGEVVVRDTIKAALRQPSVRKALADVALRAGKTLTEGAAIGVAMEGAKILAEAYGRSQPPAAAAGGPGVVPEVGPPQASTGERLLHAAVSGAQMMTGLAGYEAAASVPYERARIQQAQQNVAVLEALGGTASASKTLKRAPDAVQDFVARVTKNGPVETIYAPTDKWAEYWQSQGLDPAAVATQVTGSADAYRTAEAQGRDLPIPTARYVATLAGTEHHAGLFNDLRLGSPEAMTGNEAKKAEAAAVADIETQITQAQAAGAEAPPEWQDSPMRQQVLDLLVRGGKYTPETAAPMADLAGAVFGNMATRAGVDPAAFFDQYQLRITRPDLEARGVSTEGPPQTGEAVPATPEEVATAAGTVTDQVTPEAVTTPAEAGAVAGEPPAGVPFMITRQMEADLRTAGYTDEQVRQMTPAEAHAALGAHPEDVPAAPVEAGSPQPGLNVTFTSGMKGLTLDELEVMLNSANAENQAEAAAEILRRHSPRQPEPPVDTPPAPGETGVPDVDRPPDTRARARQTGLTASDRLAPSVARDREVTDAAGKTRLVRESRAQRAARAATHYDDLFRIVFANARALDPTVNRRALRREFDARIDMYEELAQEYRQSEADPRTLLRAIASHGGIAETGRGWVGEIRDLQEGTKFGALGGVQGVFRRRTVDDRGVPVMGKPLDVMLQHLQQDGGFPWLENTNQLLDALDEISRNPPQEDYLPGTDELYSDLRIDPTTTWWDEATRPVELTDPADFEGAETILDPDGPVDTSFNVDEFNQSLFDDIEPPDPTADRLTADVLDTGEVQPRLPGAEAVRDQEVATPQLEAPFALTAEIAKPRTKQETLFQTVYHGTPRTEPFEEFSLHAIGSGEGNQAYGYGLYFASQRAIAEHYRKLDRLGSTDWTVPGAGHVPDWVARRLSRDATAGSETFQRAVGELLTEFKARVGEAEERVASRAPQWWNDQTNLPGLRDVVESLEHIRDTGVEPQQPGKLYTVDIPDEHYLSFDQRLSQQTPQVQEALHRMGVDWTPLPRPTLAEAAQLFEHPLVREQLGHDGRAGDWLDEGLYYVQTGNNRDFQLWYDRHADLLLFRDTTDVTGGDLYDTLQQQARDAGHNVDLTAAARAASEQLAGVGLTGIRYLDGNSRSSGEGSSNYVLFDPKLARIIQYEQGAGVRPLEAADVSEWADAVRARVGPELQAFEVGLNRAGDLLLHKIVIDRGAQRAGLGSRVLQELTRLADLNGKRILLTPADRGDGWGTTSRDRLVRFYRRFGFVENKGRQRDYAISAGMYREPTAGPGLERGPGRQTESPAFRAWFGDSQVVEGDGTPQVVYHGTTQDFDTFDPARANIEGDFGHGIYFSNNPDDVGANYATAAGPDLVGKIERRAQALANERQAAGLGDGELEASDFTDAQAELVGHGGATMPVYLKLEHPVVLGGEGATRLEMTHPVDEEGDFTGEPTGTLIDFTTALRDVASEFHDVKIDEVIGRLLEAADYESVTAEKAVELLKADDGLAYATDDQGNLAGNDIIRQAFEQAGYDGIIDRTVDKKFGSQRPVGRMAGMDEDTVHYIAFAPEQVKSAIGNRGTFDPGDTNILYQSELPKGFDLVSPHLTEEEHGLLRGKRADRVVEVFKQLARDRDVMDVSLAGKSKRYWYEDSVAALRDLFGEQDAPRFAALLAAMSPQIPLPDNLREAAQMWEAWIAAGADQRTSDPEAIVRLLDEAVPGFLKSSGKNNVIRALTAEDPLQAMIDEIPRLSGPKVQSFYRNLLGHMQEVTNDTWIAKFFGISQDLFGGVDLPGTDAAGKKIGGKSATYLAVNAKIRRVAEKLSAETGEHWTPAQVQATIWAWIRTLDELADQLAMHPVDVIKHGLLTDAAIAETPDFATELINPDTPVRAIFERAGYGPQLSALESVLRENTAARDTRAGGDQPAGRGAGAGGADRPTTVGEIRSAQRLANARAGVLTELHQDEAPNAGPVHRGAIRLGPGRQVSIDLLERADLSTFLHEGGHLFLEVFGDLTDHISQIDAAARTASQHQLLADYAGLLKHLGAETRADIGRERHEEFARTFEAYLGTGKAPSVALEGAFARFRSWLLEVYTSLKRLNVRLTPEVTGILDRMVASDRAIQQAEARRGLPQLFTTPEAAGLTPAQFELYRDTITKAHRRAVQTLDEKLLADVRRQRTAEWKAQRADIEGQVTAGVHEQPVYRALAAMQRGREPNGDLIGGPATREGQETSPQRLSRQILIERYGAERLRRLPPFLYSREGGLDPDTVARNYGYSSGDEMLTAVEQAPPMRAAIEQETARRMVAEHGDLLLDGSLHEEAAAALANDRQAAVIRAELKALGQLRRTAAPFIRQERAAGAEQLRAAERERAYERRWFEAEAKLKEAVAVGKKQVEIDALQDEVDNLKRTARGGAAQIRAALAPDDVLRAHAQAQLQGQTVRAIRPELYWTAARRAGQAALDRAARQDFDGAITAKQNELINLHLYREAVRLKDDVDARTKYAKGLTQSAARKRIGKAGGSYLEQIDGILDRYDFAAISQKAIAARASLREWADGLESQGISVDLPAEVLDEARRVHYSELTVEQLQGVTDALKQIDHLATTKGRLLKAAGDADYAVVRDGVVRSIRAKNDATPLPLEFRSADMRARHVGDWFASHRKMSDLAQALDGYIDGGPMWEAFIAPINKAADLEATRKGAAAEAIGALFTAAYPGRELGTLHETQHIPAINASLSKEGRLALALNWGNETSRQRVLSDPVRKWSSEQVAAILDTLDKRDWDFVQGVWDHVDTYWADIAAKQTRVVGVAPEKVEAVPVQTKYGEYAGGYYPLKYDGRLSPRAGLNEAASQAKLGIEAAYVRSTTKRGHVETRLQHVTLPIRLELGVLYEHVEQVLHDLTHHETLIDTTRLIRDPGVQQAIYETRGDLVYKQFVKGLQDIAIGSTPAAGTALEKAANYMRTGTQLAMLGFNFWTGAQQPLGIFNGMARVGPVWVLRGMRRWLRDAATMESTTTWISDVSPMMRERVGASTQDLHDLRASFRQAGGWFDQAVRQMSGDHVTQQTITDAFLWHIGLMQRVADVPTWLGMYEKQMAAGEPEARAIAIADQAVLDAQGGGQVKDLAQVQRGGPMFRLWTTFYSYSNVIFNATAREHQLFTQTRTPAGLATFLGHLSLLYVMPAVATTMLAHAFGKARSDDDWKAWLKEAGSETLATALNTMVGGRELSQAVLGQGGARGYEGPAGTRAIQTLYKFINELEQGKLDDGFWDATTAVAGTLFRFPAAQVQRTIDGFAALESGKTTNPFVLLVGPPKKKATK